MGDKRYLSRRKAYDGGYRKSVDIGDKDKDDN